MFEREEDDERVRGDDGDGRDDGRDVTAMMATAATTMAATAVPDPPTTKPISIESADKISPLKAMTPIERVTADYEGTSLTIGPHPMAYKRADLALRGVMRAGDLKRVRAGRRVRVAGAVITRQRPGTAKGFVFLTLEDETGIANIIVRPDLFDDFRLVIVGEPFVLVEGIMQQQDDVTSVKAERLYALGGDGPPIESHDFH